MPKSVKFKLQRYSNLPPLTESSIPEPPPVYEPKNPRKSPRKVFCFPTFWELVEQHFPELQPLDAMDVIRERLPWEYRRTTSFECDTVLTVFVIATNDTEKEIQKSLDLDAINLVRDAIGFDCGDPLWVPPCSYISNPV